MSRAESSLPMQEPGGSLIFSIPLLLLSLSICCCPEIVLKSKGKGNAPEDPSPYAQKSVCMNTLGSDTSPHFSVWKRWSRFWGGVMWRVRECEMKRDFSLRLLSLREGEVRQKPVQWWSVWRTVALHNGAWAFPHQLSFPKKPSDKPVVVAAPWGCKWFTPRLSEWMETIAW